MPAFVYQYANVCDLMKRDVQLLVRLSEQEKAGFEDAAELAGISLSSWARERLRNAAIQELQQAGQKIVFLTPISIINRSDGKGN
jgi:hypothetical protein